MKKMMAVLLCLCMAVSLAAPAFAAEDAQDAAALLAGLAETIPAETDGEEETPAAVETADSGDTLLTTDSGDGSDEDTAGSDEDTAASDTAAPDDDNTASDGDGSDDGDADGDGEETPAFTVPASGSLTETITWAVDENYVLTITGTGEMPDYGSISGAPWYGCFDKLTAIVVGEGITAIGANNFAYCSASSVTLPEGLETIGEKAFQGMEKLESIDFPATLKSIGDFAFAFNSLKTIDLPDGIETLGYSAFDPSGAVTELTLPGSLTSIGENAFGVCDTLKTITVEEGITNIPYGCFINCYAVETINLPSTLELLGCAFISTQGDLDSLKTINVADKTVNGETVAFSVWEDSDGAFFTSEEVAAGAEYSGDLFPIWGEHSTPGDTGSGTIEDSWLTWTLSAEGVLTIEGCGDIPDYNEENLPPWDAIKESITSIVILHTGGADINIGTNAFAGCTNLTSFTAQSTYTGTIGAGAFQGCTALKSIVIPAPVRAIDEKAFADCTALKTITLPRSLTDLAEDAFQGCDALYSIRSNATEFRWKYLNELPETINGVTVIYGPTTSTSHGDCGDDLTWSITSTLTYEDKVMTVSGTGPMQDYGTSLDDGAPWLLNPTGQYLVIEEGVTTIGSYAFCDWETLSRVWLPEGLTAIGQGAFQDCSRITSIELPSTIETLGPDCFKDCIALESITVADKADGTAFLYWKDEAGNTLTNDQLLADEAYTGSLTAVWTGAKAGKLTDTILWEVSDDGILFINGTGAMPDFDSLSDAPWYDLLDSITAIEISEGITAIGFRAFSTCSAVSVKIPSTVKSIGGEAFAGCSKLETINLPDGLETIGERAFQTCSKLTEVTIPGSVKTMGNETFYGCTALKTITVEEGITTLPKDFAQDCLALETLNLPSTIETIGSAPTKVQKITVNEISGREFLGWLDEDEKKLSNEDLVNGEAYTGTLTAQWYGFSDVAEDAWFYDYVMYCYETGLMAGMGEGIFAPNGSATRAQVVMVLYRLDGEPEVTADCPFPDVDEDAWFHDAIVWAAENEIAVGYDDGCFYPMTEVTREQFLVFLNRFTVHKELTLNTWSELYDLADTDITDVGSISPWALEAETWSVLIGLQAGYDNGDGTYSLNPGSYITRAELATFLSRYYENINLYAYAEAAQYLTGHPAEYATRVFGETDEILEDQDGLEWWCFYNYGIAILVDRSTNSAGIVAGWDYIL